MGIYRVLKLYLVNKMKTMFILACLTFRIVISSGYADQNENVNAAILDAISQLNSKVDNFQETMSQLNSKVYRIQEEMNNMKLLFISNGLIANDVNQKISLLPTQILDMAVKLGTSIIDSVGNDLKEQEKILSNIDTNISSLESTYRNINTKINNMNVDIKAHTDTSKCSEQEISNVSGGVTALQHNSTEVNSNLFEIFPYSCSSRYIVSMLCDDDWTIIQRRQDVQPRVNFTRPWIDYVQGFGELTGEFWLGLDNLYMLTSATRNELYIELEDWENNTRWARYSHFAVGPAEDNYRLTATGYTGNAGDALKKRHNGSSFSTYDNDNDAVSSGNCARMYKGGWWYKDCHQANLNGLGDHGIETAYAVGINWLQWLGHRYSLRKVVMKIRPQAN
ncbi:unnamed protein product [Meganyctiphanes norvegica]|uniref:Fibrinogen C-terminal domain-containing protein n=1 Tax=Meganyctiphanes norvegica TaxID=48144 RepID=A0AAV2PZ91_MEGNR